MIHANSIQQDLNIGTLRNFRAIIPLIPYVHQPIAMGSSYNLGAVVAVEVASDKIDHEKNMNI